MEVGIATQPASAQHRVPSSWIFLLIGLPFGIFSGATGTLLAYLLRREGVEVGSIASEIALLGLPPMLFFLWSPLSDFWIRRRSWLVLSAGVAALLTAAAFQLSSLASTAAVVLMLAASVAEMVVSASVGGIMAALVPPEKKVRVCAMWQAGNLGGGALGAGVLLLLAEHISRPMLGLTAAAVVFFPSLVALNVDEPQVHHVPGETLGRRLGVMGSEFKTTFLRWSALPALLMLVSPMGCGAAVNLLGGIAVDYHVSGSQVAWINGMAGALLTAAGAFLAGLIPGHMDARRSYAIAGLANALSIGVLCVGPTNALTYLVGTTLYLLTVGACFAVFTALVLQLMGPAGASGGARYALVVSLGNAPMAYMAWVDGQGARWFGTRGLPGIDMAVSGAVAIAFLVWLKASQASRESAMLAVPEVVESTAEGSS